MGEEISHLQNCIVKFILYICKFCCMVIVCVCVGFLIIIIIIIILFACTFTRNGTWVPLLSSQLLTHYTTLASPPPSPISYCKRITCNLYIALEHSLMLSI